MIVSLGIEVQSSQLLPSNPLGKRLCEIFSYRWQSISGINASNPQWKTQTKYPIRSRVLWQRWNDPNVLIGVRFGSTTAYALIDIDRTSSYHPAINPAGLSLILAALETIGIVRHLLITSSSSGGLHLYLPLPHAVSTFGLAQALKQCLAAQGIETKAGQVELFPNTKAYAAPGTQTEYNAHRLPLQPDSGSYLLDAEGNSIGNDLGQFFCHWDTVAAGQDLELLHEAIAVARRNSHKYKRNRICIVDEWRDDLKTEINEGWTGNGQTNHLLKTIACYGVVFERLTGDDLAKFIEKTAINSPGYTTYCRHQHEITQRSILWARSAEKYWWALGSEPKCRKKSSSRSGSEDKRNASINQNQVRAEDAQRRIQESVTRLQRDGQFPKDITSRVRLLTQEAHTSVKTLYRYQELWHPEHQNSHSSEERVIAVAASDSGDETPIDADIAKSLESRQTGELHTSEGDMKCYRTFGSNSSTDDPISEPCSDQFNEVLLENPYKQIPLTDEKSNQRSSSEAIPEFEQSDRSLDQSNEVFLENSCRQILSPDEKNEQKSSPESPDI